MRLRVELDKTFLERLRTSPRKGVSELVWNALDADAETIQVEFDVNEVGGVTAITVTDDGHGMTTEEASEAFRRLGGSWKATTDATRTKRRALHGREGRGRFLAAKIAGRARWTSIARCTDGENHKTIVEIYRRSLDDVDIRGEGTTHEPSGTVVVLSDFDAPPIGLGGSAVADRLTGEFALYLTKYPVEITYDGFAIDPKALQASTATYELDPPGEYEAHLDVVEWSRPMDRRLFLCDHNGTALSELPPASRSASTRGACGWPAPSIERAADFAGGSPSTSKPKVSVVSVSGMVCSLFVGFESALGTDWVAQPARDFSP